MSYKVAIRKNETGEVRLYEQTGWDWVHDDGMGNGPHDDFYWWTNGNMGCDCNRELCFERVGKTPEQLKELESLSPLCGDTRFTVLYVLTKEGEKILIEEKA
jgi:hypothetical protein